MTLFFGIKIPDNKVWLAKDLCTIIYNLERKKYPHLMDAQYRELLRKRIVKRYNKAKGEKTLIEILKEYRKEL